MALPATSLLVVVLPSPQSIVQLCTEFSGPMKERSKFIVTAAVLARFEQGAPILLHDLFNSGSSADNVRSPDTVLMTTSTGQDPLTVVSLVAVSSKSYSPAASAER